MNWNKKLLSKVHKLVIDEISRYYLVKAKELALKTQNQVVLPFSRGLVRC